MNSHQSIAVPAGAVISLQIQSPPDENDQRQKTVEEFTVTEKTIIAFHRKGDKIDSNMSSIDPINVPSGAMISIQIIPGEAENTSSVRLNKRAEEIPVKHDMMITFQKAANQIEVSAPAKETKNSGSKSIWPNLAILAVIALILYMLFKLFSES